MTHIVTLRFSRRDQLRHPGKAILPINLADLEGAAQVAGAEGLPRLGVAGDEAAAYERVCVTMLEHADNASQAL